MEATGGVILTTLALLVAGWSLVGRRAQRWDVTAPMAFIVAGIIVGLAFDERLDAGTVLDLAEISLALVLFHDASTVRLAELRRDPWIQVRLLVVGFPLALVLTAATTVWLLPGIGLAGAVLVAGAVTATDAGLGAPTILNPVVPIRVRRALNVESGLNDGLATPVVLVALGLMVSASSQTLEPQARSAVSLDLPSSLGGVGLGVVLGVAFAVALDRSRAAGWSSPRARQLGVLAVPVLALAAAELVGANVFLAAFLAGLAFGGVSRCLKEEPEVSQTVEAAADVFGDVVWFLAGWLVVLTFSNGFRMQWLVLALVVLTVLRLVPVAIALLGCGFRRPTVLFVGWFGPRGVATIVFCLIAFEELAGDPRMVDIAGVLSLTALISVFVHGITASPLAERYGAWAMRAHDAVENEPSVEPMPARGRHA